jgi:hypothetical protein
MTPNIVLCLEILADFSALRTRHKGISVRAHEITSSLGSIDHQGSLNCSTSFGSDLRDLLPSLSPNIPNSRHGDQQSANDAV